MHLLFHLLCKIPHQFSLQGWTSMQMKLWISVTFFSDSLLIFVIYLPFPFLQFLSQSSPPEDNCSPHLSPVLWARLERVAPEVEGRKWQSVEKREKLVSFKPEGNCCRPMSSLEDRIRYITVMSSKCLPVIHGSNVLPKKLRIEYGWEKFICTFQRTEVLDFFKLSPPALYGLIAPKLNSACWHRKFPSRSKNNSGFGEGERELGPVSFALQVPGEY